MDEMQNFILWCLQEIPPVLLEPPISAFVGLAFLGVTVRLFRQMIHIR